MATIDAGRVLRLTGELGMRNAQRTLGPVLRAIYNVQVEGEHVVPRFGPAIIAPNHLSFIDPFFVALAIPRHVRYIGKAEYMDSWTTRWFMELGGVIPVRREDSVSAQGSLAAGTDVLKQGHVLGIFPEGTRSPDGRLYKGKTGAARMALDAGCPVIPTGLVGTREILPKDAKFPVIGPRVRVRFGTPMRVPKEAAENPRILRTFTDDVMAEIARLTHQTYRNRYAYTKKVGPPAEGMTGFS